MSEINPLLKALLKKFLKAFFTAFQTQQDMNHYLSIIDLERVFLLKVGATAENFTWNSMYVLFLPIFETKLVKGFVRCSFQIEIKILWSV